MRDTITKILESAAAMILVEIIKKAVKALSGPKDR